MFSFQRREFLFVYKAVFFSLLIPRLNNSSSILIFKTQCAYLKPTDLLVYNNTNVVMFRYKDSKQGRLEFMGSKEAESEVIITSFEHTHSRR